MTPQTEPNALPPVFDSWQDWRNTYTTYVEDYARSPKTVSDRLLLEIRLKRLGFVGLNLFSELQYVCTQPH